MRNRLTGLLLFCMLLTLPAKDLDSLSFTPHQEFVLKWDNDMYLFKDYYYTQGAKLEYVHPALRKNPINHILFHLPDADQYYSLGIIQEIYTPKDVHDSLLNVVDRPYAGTFYIRSATVSSLPNRRIRLTSEFDFGVLGPLSGAQQAQQYIHDWLGLGSPAGWDFQIDNQPYFNYNLILEKGFEPHNGIFDVIGNTRLRVGTVHDDLRVGALFRLGYLNDYFKGLNLSNKIYPENRDIQVFLFGGGNFTAVLYNATLMGGIIPPESNHQFKPNEITNLIGEVYGGIHLSYKMLGARGQILWKSKEFDNGIAHGWGTVSIYLRF